MIGDEKLPWTTCGGGGYWIKPAKGHKDYWFAGWLLQKQLTDTLTLGGEIFYASPDERGGDSHTGCNFGGTYDLSEHWHVLFSAGRDIDGPNGLTTYLGIQLPF